jgi:hypothetical protein
MIVAERNFENVAKTTPQQDENISKEGPEVLKKLSQIQRRESFKFS